MHILKTHSENALRRVYVCHTIVTDNKKKTNRSSIGLRKVIAKLWRLPLMIDSLWPSNLGSQLESLAFYAVVARI